MQPKFESMMMAAQESQNAEKEKRSRARNEMIAKKMDEIYSMRENQVKLKELVEKSGIQTNETDDFMLETNLETEHLMRMPEVDEAMHNDASNDKKINENKVRDYLDQEWIQEHVKLFPLNLIYDPDTVSDLKMAYPVASEIDQGRIVDIYEGLKYKEKFGIDSKIAAFYDLIDEKEGSEEIKKVFGDLTKEEAADSIKTTLIIDACKRFYKVSRPEEKERLLKIIESYRDDKSERVKEHAEKVIEELTGKTAEKEAGEAVA